MNNLLQGGAAWAWMPSMAAGAVINGLWQGAVLAVAAWVLLRVIPGTSAAVRYMVWAVVFGTLCLLPLADGYAMHAHQARPDGVVQLNVRWSFAIAAAWAAFSLVRLIRLATGARRLREIWRRARPVEECAALDGRVVEICTSDDVDRPSVIGFLSPRILIPPVLYERLSAHELEQVVLHEMGHLRRRDDWLNLLQKVGLVVLPLNPALLWVERRMCFERELACDDSVLEQTRAPKAYARCLTNLAETRLGHKVATLSLGAWERQSVLARRVRSILAGGWRMRRTEARAVLCVAVAVVLGGAAELARCPQVVSFSDNDVSVAATRGNRPMIFDDGRGTDRGHVTLLKASAPVRKVADGLVGDGVVMPTKKDAAKPTVVRKVKRAPALAAPALIRTTQHIEISRRAGVMVMSSWQDDSEQTSPVRLVLTEDRGGQRRGYAAVATEGGWLLFEL